MPHKYMVVRAAWAAVLPHWLRRLTQPFTFKVQIN